MPSGGNSGFLAFTTTDVPEGDPRRPNAQKETCEDSAANGFGGDAAAPVAASVGEDGCNPAGDSAASGPASLRQRCGD